MAQQKIKVVHICGKLGPGGIESWINNICKSDSAVFEQALICITRDKGVFDSNIISRGVKIHYVAATLKSPLSNLAQIKKILRQESADIIHLHRYKWNGVYSLFRFLGYKVVNHSHNKGHDGNLKSIRSSFADRVLLYLINSLSDRKLACSTEAAVGMFHTADQVAILPYGVDFNRFRSDKKVAADEIRILHVGRFVKFKNHEFILALAKIFQDNGDTRYQFDLVGSGPEEARIKALAKEYALENVRFHEPIFNVEKHFKKADIFLLPSHNEGLGIVALEAQAAGLYTLISDKVPASAIVDTLHCKALALDADLWYNAIRQFETITVDRIKMNDLMVASPFSHLKSIKELEDIYEGISSH